MEKIDYHEEPRATGLVRPVLGSVLLNDTIYIVSDSMIWSLPINTLNEEHSQLTAVTPIPPIASSALPVTIIADAHSNGFLIMDGSFKTYQFNIKSRQLSTLPMFNNTTTMLPSHRVGYASVSTADDQAMLIHGGKTIVNGSATTTCVKDTFWSFNLFHRQWTSLKTDDTSRMRYGHTLSMLRDGRVVMLGGKSCIQDNRLLDMANAVVYDTHKSQWYNQVLNGQIPAPRMYHSAVTTSQDKIVICGGQDGTPPPFHTYLSTNRQLKDMAALLDTTTWEWKDIESSVDNQPLPQVMASALIVNGTKMVYGLGESYQTIHDGLYMLDSEALKWQPRAIDFAWLSEGQTASPGTVLGVAAIIALCFAFIVLLALAWILWRLGRQAIFHGIFSLRSELWDPRPGEPGWIEICRLAMKFAFGSYIVYLVFSLTSQIMHSPIIDQLSYDQADDGSIDVPDVRFCFDNIQQQEPFVRCSTDYGIQCSQYLQKFYPPTARERVCTLFRAPDTVRLASPIHRKAAGSYLKFDYYGNAAQVQISIYHRNHDPNLDVYNLKTKNDTFGWTTPYEESHFRAAESATYHHYEQQHLVAANRIHTGSYALGKRIALEKESWWNYIGYASDTTTWYQVTSSKLVSEASPPIYLSGEQPLGSLHLFPERYSTQIISEQRAFTVLQALGVLGGMFGLLVTAQHWLFGYRPRSPYGVVQRWSIGQMRMSLLKGLVRNFKQQHENVPIVHPLKKTSAAHERMGRLEDRLHTLEQLFQAYYIDDEIFQSLDQAFTQPRPTTTTNNRPTNDSLLRLRLPSFKKAKESTSL
ncbi:hypothetical protein BDA99DRAFT_571562 [Phascolomyces articulosus]|uniref:Galactose oxidase n=1 Tax=Phascolomyces articulosus TaxID=60185 RepID=A0AAD5KA72_9FUNG|nr:hypothetical protein BDA99DRAFT_571562 [Phascolomyces articulosus]